MRSKKSSKSVHKNEISCKISQTLLNLSINKIKCNTYIRCGSESLGQHCSGGGVRGVVETRDSQLDIQTAGGETHEF